MVVDDKVLDQLIDFVETNKKYGKTCILYAEIHRQVGRL